SSAVERNVGVDLHYRVLMHQHLFAECRQVGELHDWLATQEQSLRLSRRQLHRWIIAEIGAPGGAVFAGATEDRRAGDDPIARLKVDARAADRLYHRGSLMA